MSDMQKKSVSTGKLLFLYDVLVFFAMNFLLLRPWLNQSAYSFESFWPHCGIAFVCLFGFRCVFSVYKQVWRYGGIQCYIWLLISDGCAFLSYLLLNYLLPIQSVSFPQVLAIICANCLSALAMRMLYRYAYKAGRFKRLFRLVSFGAVEIPPAHQAHTIRIAIVGAGRVGVALADELLSNASSAYTPYCFIENDPLKMNRRIHDMPVLPEDKNLLAELHRLEVQQIVLALPRVATERKKELYEFFTKAGYPVKLYDVPVMQSAEGKRQLRDFDVDDLLFRKPIVITNDRTCGYYAGKTVLITGGGGSIGSELCRQLAKMSPKRLVILDIYENGAYDIQQELKMTYQDAVDVRVVIVSVCNREGLKRVFEEYRPQLVIHAAAHKHVPLMEHDSVEAVENNVFGTLNVLETADAFGAERFMLVSTDKAVNPTNVMGATKRMCEMLVLNYPGKMKCSATRFGNVLGSAGSVIPLFKRQIASGGPITLTDKRIIRYFMTIPEASQLVLQSGAIAKRGELLVLDMGKPVKILDLAENMIRLSGQTNIEIVETGLRPGEKLYEELLVKTEHLDKTENDLIFIERDEPLPQEVIAQKMACLRDAAAQNSNAAMIDALHAVVPTFQTPQEVNGNVPVSGTATLTA